MKRLFLSLFLFLPIFVIAQGERQQDNRERVKVQRKYEIVVNQTENKDILDKTNAYLESQGERARSLGTALAGALTSTATGGIVGMSNTLLSLGVNYLTTSLKKDDWREWYNTASKQCKYSRTIKTDTKIDDFYGVPSVKGAMDPSNMIFDGFGCRYYMECEDKPGFGDDVFYIFCKMNREEDGLNHIINHSKFYVDVDSFVFVPRNCDLPNDSIDETVFDFSKRENLTLTVRTRIYSSWINEAVMVNNDQLLGEFVFTANIDPKIVEKNNGRFIYDKNDPACRQAVSITGDSFIVPRSFTGTTDARNYQPAWGTGQYRIEMEVMQSCTIKDDYYHEKTTAERGNQPGKEPKWDKNKWMPEWKEMNRRKKNSVNFFNDAWQSIASKYENGAWVTVLTEPLKTTIIQEETKALTGVFSTTSSASSAAPSAASSAIPSAGAQPSQGQGVAAGGQKPNQ